MTTRDAWLTVLLLVVVLLAMLFVAGVVSEWLVPTVRTEICEAWSQAPSR